MKTCITNIQRFCMHDGPGIRTVVFFKGCPLRCRWCHNPEAQSFGQSEAQTACTSESWLETDQILLEVQKDIAFYGSLGGITLSGGEPMAQPDAALALLKAAKNAGISTAVETCGCFDKALLPDLCRYTDTLLWDFKDSDDRRHLKNTGVSNQRILSNLRLADQYGTPIILRCILLKGINDTKEHFAQIRQLKASLAHAVRVDFLPYHPMGEAKMRLLGIENSFHNQKYRPTPEDLEHAYAALESESYHMMDNQILK